MTQLGRPGRRRRRPRSAQPVYAFNTDSMAGLAMVNQLLGQGATVARGGRGVRRRRRALRHRRGARRRARRSSLAHADRGRGPVGDAGLRAERRTRSATSRWRCRRSALYTGGTTAPTNPAFHGTGDGQCRTSTAYCEAMFDLTQKEGIPTSQIGQLTSTDLANGVLRERRLHGAHQPGLDDLGDHADRHGGTPAQAVRRSSTPAAPTSAPARDGTTSARNAGDHDAEHDHDQRASARRARRSTPTWNTVRPRGLGLRRRRLDLPRVERRPDLRPGHAGRQRRRRSRRPTAVGHLRPRRRLRRARRVRQLLRLRDQRQRQPARAGRRSSTSRSAPATRSCSASTRGTARGRPRRSGSS